MFEDILIPTDGSECAQMAVDYAKELANHYGSTIHVLCVVDYRDSETGPHYEQMKEEGAEIAARVSDEVSSAGCTTEQAVRTEVPHRAILEYVTEQGIDLVVIGSHGRTGFERYLLGSVTEKVVRLSDVPVLTVKSMDDRAVTYPYDDILLPTDGSDGATAAIPPAVDIASTYDARLHALSVVDTMAMGADVRSEVILNKLEAMAQTAVEAVEERAIQESVSAVNTVIEYGSPYREIRSYVEEHDIDLVVMGTHGRSGIERYLLGSVAEKTVRTSSVPVMTVRQPNPE